MTWEQDILGCLLLFLGAAKRRVHHYSAIAVPVTLDHLNPTLYLTCDKQPTFVEAGMRCRTAAGMTDLVAEVS
jgi:hypothetical protein